MPARPAPTQRGRGMNAYVTSTGAFLPGPPIGNDEIEAVLGLVDGRRSRLKARILKANGIQTRHYAIDRSHRTTHSNEDLAVQAAEACLRDASLPARQIGLLSCATTQGDLVIPGFGSMVQARLGMPEVELHTAHGICSSSVMALRAAVNTLRLGEQSSALVVVSELASRLFKHTRYEAAGGHGAIDFNAEFLRWMLSDGAGAWLLETRPRGRCLRVDWIRSYSHADALPLCMSIGRPTDAADTRSWQDYATYAEAEAAGALLIRQDVRLLEHIVKLGVDGALRLIAEGLLDVRRLDHLLCHYSSHHFRSRIFELLEMCGASVPYEKWFTNLYTRGNTGCASIMIMLDEFLREGRAQPGQTILCMVPESGRFNVAYVHLTMVES
jgi:3-oxoacyl-[acyl-carrier-protein] synthase III